jgi:hypothetical protein
MKSVSQVLVAIAAIGVVSEAQPSKVVEPAKKSAAVKLSKAEMATVTAGSSANFSPGQFPAGNPAQAPGKSNPNQHPNK